MAEKIRNIQIYTERQRTLKLNREKERLAELFKNIDITKLKLVENLINEAAFQRITLEETREIINRDGVIEEYQNGANQKGIKKSSAVEVYDKMVNTYSRIIKQLCDLLPGNLLLNGQEQKEDDPEVELMEYVNRLKR